MLTFKANRLSWNKLTKVDDTPSLSNSHTNHMITIEYENENWGKARLQPYKNFELPPFSKVLHYAQACFEGMKAHRLDDGSISIFRLKDHYDRFVKSSKRLAIPYVTLEIFSAALNLLISSDSNWIPNNKDGLALYLRPFVFATEESLAVKPAIKYCFSVVATPIYGYYGIAKGGKEEIDVMLNDTTNYIRAAKGGTGHVKFSGNYPGCFVLRKLANKYGCSQILWLDAQDHLYIEELDTMNIFFLCELNNKEYLLTPSAQENEILPGITRDSIIQLCNLKQIQIIEDKINYKKLFHGDYGVLKEAFATGTACNLISIKTIYSTSEKVAWKTQCSKYSDEFANDLLDIKLNRMKQFQKWHTILSESQLNKLSSINELTVS